MIDNEDGAAFVTSTLAKAAKIARDDPSTAPGFHLVAGLFRESCLSARPLALGVNRDAAQKHFSLIVEKLDELIASVPLTPSHRLTNLDP